MPSPSSRRSPGTPTNQLPEACEYAWRQSGLTKRQLAAMCGISEQYMGQIISGKRSAKNDVLNRMASALNCPRVLLERRRVVEVAK